MLLNGVQAYCTNIEADEAYYWLFSRNLDWGYFDHPPFVALSVKAGEIFGHGSLFTRLGTVFLSAGSVYFGYLALPGHLRNTRLYVLCFASIIILNVYGFIVTPDASLLFFTALFFYCYRLYLDDQKFSHVFLLAISIAGLLYSKYQGVLPVFFTFLSNPKLALKRSAWMVVLIAALFFLPHLWWQQTHGWPTVQYHLFERGRTEYKIEKTTNYILGQLLIWGPLTTLPA
ncbi:MAG TPA: glycosyltransferase family 39 protein, partial [Chitinophagaceae bacterium]|nr:glycosyltransferase family 39 protein [Chitinophagaceae bacterium]